MSSEIYHDDVDSLRASSHYSHFELPPLKNILDNDSFERLATFKLGSPNNAVHLPSFKSMTRNLSSEPLSPRCAVNIPASRGPNMRSNSFRYDLPFQTSLSSFNSIPANLHSSISRGEGFSSPNASEPSAPHPAVYTRPFSKKTDKGASAQLNYCSNCKTTTTPLWRRDSFGKQVCNACGLYQKSYGKTRPVDKKKLDSNSLYLEKLMNSTEPDSVFYVDHSGSSVSYDHHSHCYSDDSDGCPGNGHCNGKGGAPQCAGCPSYNQLHVSSHDRRQRLKKKKPYSPDHTKSSKSHSSLICYNCKTDYTPLWRRDDFGNVICNACGLYYKLHKQHRPVSMKKNVIKRRNRISHNPSSPSKHSPPFSIQDYSYVRH
ncbi:Suppressor of ferric uptake 1 [Smittium mucronatum]|uniref:Suppressor of ferric uptake 1 n=1 Tax=Smittium mucronatum TaxID=133383 RepID=A0A1R0GWY7_9FUNG|nr:Suppressor of ferric uptake 1 [Smittium mucronatum]